MLEEYGIKNHGNCQRSYSLCAYHKKRHDLSTQPVDDGTPCAVIIKKLPYWVLDTGRPWQVINVLGAVGRAG